MKLKVTVPQHTFHKAAATCLSWSSTEELYSVSDDNQLLSWNVSNNEATKITDFNCDLLPTDIHFLPRIGGALGKHGDLILITSTDGKFHTVNRSGRIEKSIDAHKGAILVGQWSNDGASLLTAGEDGFIKIWSRGGMLRSTVVSSDHSIYGACWSPDNQSIVYTNGKFLVIKQLAPNTKPQKWKAHEGVTLCLSWSAASELIVSGGEECRYRVWDSHGRQLYSSSLHDNPITSLAWSPSGDLFAVGSYNTLRLCDYSGWSQSLEKPITGCIYKIAWSSDGTQLAGACANGHVIFAHIVDREVQYMNYTATVTERKTIIVRDALHDTLEVLELPERVIQLSLRYSHLVLTTPTQCYIYSASGQIQSFQWNTEENILATIQDTHLVVWYCPTGCFDPTLFRMCSLINDSLELSRNPRINDFVGNSVSIRRTDGSLLNVPISPFPALLHRYVQDNKWTDALNLCRTTNDVVLWSCLAILATQLNGDTLDIAEESYAAINQYDKEFPTKAQQIAGAALLGGGLHNAESILIHNGMLFHAIRINLQLYNWNRALDTALKHKTHIDTVLYMRQKYLEQLGKEEPNKKFVDLRNSIGIDEEKIKQKIQTEMTRAIKH
ncbi:outer segment 5 [Holotrichia oblita]|uniref:Outer segment 5 n=1 Tax=Holotrichia oblita TaxID=644536 RepID=A0ACB9TE14_HOLOL|nr:outer segment 5 [Holotrichia oblita]